MGQHLYLVAFDQTHAPEPRERREQQHTFGHRELLAEAAARAAAEREEGVCGPRRSRFGSPAFRVELFRIGEEARVSVHRVLADDDERARRDTVAADGEVSERATHEPPRGRIEAHRLAQHALRVL